jgi:hypothetical protein
MKSSPVFALAILLVASRPAPAVQFPEYNFSLEVPSGWRHIQPLLPGELIAAESADKSQCLTAGAAKFPAKERATAASDIRVGSKKSMSALGWRIDPEEKLTINSQPFISFVGHGPDGSTVTVYTTGAGDTWYMIQAVRHAGNVSDSELRSFVQSFRLLTAAATPPLEAPPKAVAFGDGYTVERFLYHAIVPGTIFVVWLIRRDKDKSKPA